ncbi:MAG: polysaccharide lyase family 7 protein [Cyclobacteriaceae bacterium]
MMNRIFGLLLLSILSVSCENSNKQDAHQMDQGNAEFPGDVIPLAGWDITLGNGVVVDTLENYQHPDYFFTENDGTDWVVFKAPNSGVTTKNSSNTRTELKQDEIEEGEENVRWIPKDGGKLTGTLKVMNVSTTGDARVGAAYSVVVGQIHSNTGHKNEPLKIFYKKYPSHTKGSVFWNYEINTEGDNSGRWDFATSVWGYDWSVLGTAPDTYPEEPEDGIELGETFSYVVNVYEGIMYLSFKSEGHESRTFTKSMLTSDFISREDFPKQIEDMFVPIGREGTERVNAYEGEIMFFAQGAYNQANGGDPESNMVWSTGSDTYGGDLKQQYANGSFAEVWFSESSVSPGTPPNQ